jgi:hypothetical protein
VKLLWTSFFLFAGRNQGATVPCRLYDPKASVFFPASTRYIEQETHENGTCNIRQKTAGGFWFTKKLTESELNWLDEME